MKWIVVALLGAFAGVPGVVSAQEILPIGNIPRIESAAPTMWAMSGFEIINIKKSDGAMTPIMRSEVLDARTVEILSRVQSPPLRASDIKTMGNKIVVRRYLLAEVKPQDARAEGVSTSALTARWAASTRRVLPQVAPLASRFGI